MLRKIKLEYKTIFPKKEYTQLGDMEIGNIVLLKIILLKQKHFQMKLIIYKIWYKLKVIFTVLNFGRS